MEGQEGEAEEAGYELELHQAEVDIWQDVTHKGHLYIFSSFNRRRWGKRWCLVRNNMFECYRSDQSHQCELNFLLGPCVMRRAVLETNSQLALMLLEQDKERITVEPVSKADMYGWVQVLMSDTSTSSVPEGLEEFMESKRRKGSDATSILSFSVLKQWDMDLTLPTLSSSSYHDYEDPVKILSPSRAEDQLPSAENPSQSKADGNTDSSCRTSGRKEDNVETMEENSSMWVALKKEKGDLKLTHISDRLAAYNKNKHTTDSGFYSVKGNNSDSDAEECDTFGSQEAGGNNGGYSTHSQDGRSRRSLQHRHTSGATDRRSGRDEAASETSDKVRASSGCREETSHTSQRTNVHSDSCSSLCTLSNPECSFASQQISQTSSLSSSFPSSSSSPCQSSPSSSMPSSQTWPSSSSKAMAIKDTSVITSSSIHKEPSPHPHSHPPEPAHEAWQATDNTASEMHTAEAPPSSQGLHDLWQSSAMMMCAPQSLDEYTPVLKRSQRSKSPERSVPSFVSNATFQSFSASTSRTHRPEGANASISLEATKQHNVNTVRTDSRHNGGGGGKLDKEAKLAEGCAKPSYESIYEPIDFPDSASTAQGRVVSSSIQSVYDQPEHSIENCGEHLLTNKGIVLHSSRTVSKGGEHSDGNTFPSVENPSLELKITPAVNVSPHGDVECQRQKQQQQHLQIYDNPGMQGTWQGQAGVTPSAVVSSLLPKVGSLPASTSSGTRTSTWGTSSQRPSMDTLNICVDELLSLAADMDPMPSPSTEFVSALVGKLNVTEEELKVAIDRLNDKKSHLKRKKIAVHDKRLRVSNDEKRLACEKEFASLERADAAMDQGIGVLQNHLEVLTGQALEVLKKQKKKTGSSKKKGKKK